jgi:hypothetical protein
MWELSRGFFVIDASPNMVAVMCRLTTPDFVERFGIHSAYKQARVFKFHFHFHFHFSYILQA